MDQATQQGAATSSAAILSRDAQHNSGLWQPEVVFVRGEGVRLFDADGREYLDCMAGIAVASLGHNHPRLTSAIAKQAERLIVCPQNMGNDVRAELSDKLFEMVRPPLTRVFYANSGGEANEAALKWARVATGRHRFVAARHGFSGRTLGVLPLTWEPAYREPFAPLGVEVDFVTFNDLAELEAAVSNETAAVLLEPIQGESGVHCATDAYLKLARELTEKHGALLILDEIQSGVGRTGTFLASETAGVSPDIVTLAKGLGGGVPIGATLMTEAVAASMPKGGHGTTFGGNPLAAAAGLAVLSELVDSDLMGAAREHGERLQRGLRDIGAPVVSEVRGVGLMIGVQLNVEAGPVIAALREAGVITVAAGGETVRYLPPLVISAAEVDEVVARSAEVLLNV